MGLITRSARRYYEGVDGVQNSGDESYGSYQFISLENVISQFIIAYVGEDKLIPKIKRVDVSFHAQRALQELSFDTFKSCKSLELEVPNTLQLPLPQDYVNYVKLSWVDNNGIQRVLQPASKTSNPKAFQQNADGTLKFESNSYQSVITDPFQEYGITKTGKESAFDGDGLIKSNNPLEQYRSELRVDFDTDGTSNLKYGATLFSANSDQRVSDGMFIQLRENHDLVVGTSVIGPGIPNGTTIHAINSITGSSSFPYNVTLSSSQYEQYLLNPTTTLVNTWSPTIANASQNRFDNEELIFVNLNKKSNTKSKFQTHVAAENVNLDYDSSVGDRFSAKGARYGLDPQHSQINGSYYIDCESGIINFGSNISGKTVIIEYISDSLGTDEEMRVHKFAEEAMYKCIAHAVMSTRANVPEYLVNRFKKERYSAIRTAKLRLSNLKIEELTQILRGKSKQIKH